MVVGEDLFRSDPAWEWGPRAYQAANLKHRNEQPHAVKTNYSPPPIGFLCVTQLNGDERTQLSAHNIILSRIVTSFSSFHLIGMNKALFPFVLLKSYWMVMTRKPSANTCQH